MALNAKQRAFVAQYLIDKNGAQAAIRAGYSEKTARTIASELLAKPDIKDAVEKGLKRIEDRANVTAERIRQELATLGYANLLDYVELRVSGGKQALYLKPLAELPPGASAAISELIQEKDGRIRVKLHSKTHALELLGRHKKMFTDKHELTGPNGGPIAIDDYTGLSDAQRAAKLAALFDAARARAAGPAADDGQAVASAAGSADAGLHKPS